MYSPPGFKNLRLLVLMMFFHSCEPGLSGELKVFNESDQELSVKLFERGADTVERKIHPHSRDVIKILSGRGSNRNICCPCELDTIVISSTLGLIKKNPMEMRNWTVPNKNRLKKFFGPEAKCEYHVIQSDL